MQYRRRSSRADGAVMRAASAGAAVEQLALEDAAAVAVPSSPAAASAAAADLQLVGQELVPVIQGQATTGASVENGHADVATTSLVKATPTKPTPSEGGREGFQTPSVQVQSLRNEGGTPNSNGNRLELAKIPKKSRSVPNGPLGTPISYGPTHQSIPTTPAPLFSAEQVHQMNELRGAHQFCQAQRWEDKIELYHQFRMPSRKGHPVRKFLNGI